jgi:hypothetical protein
MSDRNQSWSALIVSNVLMTLPVIVCFTVVGWVFSDALMWFIVDRSQFFPEFLHSRENVRMICLFAFISSAFVISQICFTIRILKLAESRSRLWPLNIRFRLLSSILLMLAAAGLLWINMTETSAVESTNYFNNAKGWPFRYTITSGWVGSPPETIFDWSNIFINIVFCCVLLFVMLIVIEFFFSLKASTPAAGQPSIETQKTAA